MGIQFDFPRAPWSAQYVEPLKDLLSKRNFEYEIQQVTPVPALRPQDQVSEFIVVDLNQIWTLLSNLPSSYYFKIFKLDPGNNVTVWFKHISIHVEKIGF